VQPELQLIRAAAYLARSNPDGWRQFLAAFNDYHQQQLDTLVASPIDTLHVAQGYTRATARMKHFFDNCTSMADQYEGRK